MSPTFDCTPVTVFHIIEGFPKAYPLKHLKRAPVVNDIFRNNNLVILSDAKKLTVRVYERREHKFSELASTDSLIDAQGDEWQISEEAHRFSRTWKAWCLH